MNEILTSLANRSEGFENPCLVTGQNFTPWAGDSAYNNIREILRLRDFDSDYALIGLLSTIEAYPEVRLAFGESVRTYDPAGVAPYAYQVTNGVLMADQNGPARVTRHESEWPPAHEIHFVNKGGNRGLVYTDSRQETVPVSTFENFIHPIWPSWTGVNGKLEAQVANWDDYHAIIRHNPVNFPHSSIVGQLEASADLRTLLSRQGLEIPYYYAGSDAEKVAVAALAYGLSNKRVYPDA